MSEWLDLMLEEVVRKKREARDAEEEIKRRNKEAVEKPRNSPGQSK